MRNRIVWLIVTGLALGCMYTWARSAVRLEGSDGSQIRSAVLSAINAVNSGRVSEAMSVVSPNYKDSTGLNHDRLWVLLHRAVDNRQYWSVSARNISPEITGPEATVAVDLIVRVDGEPREREYILTLDMLREDTHVWGIVPTQRWRVESVSGTPEELMELSN